jgi:hypothetical protein
MVIQANMSPKAIVEVWEDTTVIFQKSKIPLTTNPLESFVEKEQLNLLLRELNAAVGSSTATCIEGG